MAGGVSPAVGVPAAVLAGWRRHRARQPEVGRVFVPGSIEPPWLGHAWPRARRARGVGARAGGGEGEPCSGGLCAGVAMGRGPRLLAAGCEQLGAATPISAGLERLLLPCPLPSCAAAPRITLMGMGMEGGPDPCRISPSWGRSGLPSALHLPVAMAAGGFILPVCGVGGCPERPLPPGALAGCRRGSGFLCCHRGMGTSPMSRPPACHSTLPRAPWERDRTPSMTHTMAWGRRVSLFPSRLQPVPAGALQFGEVVRIVGKIQMPQSGYK